MNKQWPEQADHKLYEDFQPRSWKQAMWRGFRNRCPACGKGHLFQSYLKVNDHCPACHEALFHQQADDAPPYFTITIVGHIIIPAVVMVESIWHPDSWVHLALWLPLTLLLTFFLMSRVKGSVIGLQWALGMHGFGKEPRVEAHENHP